MKIKTLTLAGISLLTIMHNDSAARQLPASLTGKAAILPSHATRDQAMKYALQVAAQLHAGKPAHAGATSKTTAATSRIIAYAYNEFKGSGFLLTDTAHLKYSYGRGGDLTSDFIRFDEAKAWSYDETISKLQEAALQTHTFDAGNNILTQLSKEWDPSSSALENANYSFYTYTADKQIATDSTQKWNGSAWENDAKRKVIYNTAKNMIADSNYEWDGSDWQANYVSTYTYTASGKKATYSAWYYESTFGMWLEIMKTTYTYDASDLLIGELLQTFGSSLSLENYMRTTYTYDASKNQVGQVDELWNSAMTAWVNSGKYNNKFDASNNKIESIYLEWDDAAAEFDTTTRTLYTYNTYKQETSEATATWDGAAWDLMDGDTKTIYYYEEYEPASVKEQMSGTASVSIFPVPANDELHICIQPSVSQSLTICLMDLNGRLLQSQESGSATQYSGTLSVSGLPSGSYLCLIKGDKGLQVTQKVTIAH